MAHYYSIQSETDSTKNYLDSLYAMNQNDLLVQELMTQTLSNVVSKLSEGKEAAAGLKKYFAAYPFFKKNVRMQDYYIYCLSRETGMNFSSGNNKEGLKYLDELKAALDGQPDLARRTTTYVVMAVGEACSYYARQQNYKTLRDLLVFMKKLIPDNEEINRRLTKL